MSVSTRLFSKLFDLAAGKPLSTEDEGRSSRLMLVSASLLFAILLAAVWGLAVGTASKDATLLSVVKVPVVVALSALAAIPAGLLSWKLMGGAGRASDLLLSFAAGLLAGSLVLAVSAPIVAIYYHSSHVGGPLLGQASTFLALGVGSAVFLRAALRRAEPSVSRKRRVVPAVVLLAAQVACVVQLIALASPILPEHTIFDQGIDKLSQGAH